MITADFQGKGATRSTASRIPVRQRPSGRTALCRAVKPVSVPVRQGRDTERFSSRNLEIVDTDLKYATGMVLSPDDHCMACLSYPDSKRVAVFREQEGLTQPVAQLDGSQPLTGLAFSADGSSLRALGKYGSLYEWQRDGAGRWQPGTQTPLAGLAVPEAPMIPRGSGLHMTVRQVVHSPDSRLIAVCDMACNMTLFGKTGKEGWQPQIHRRWPTGEPRFADPRDQAQIAFSADSQTLLFAALSQAFVWKTSGHNGAWTSCRLTVGGPYSLTTGDHYPGAALAPDGRCLALCSTQQQDLEDTRCRDTACTLSVHHFVADKAGVGPGQWPVTARKECRSRDSEHPMAFSPDGQWLAFPCRQWQPWDDNRLAVLSVSSPEQVEWLAFGYRPRLFGDPHHLVQQVQFSATGECLAAMAGAGVQLWQRKASSCRDFPRAQSWSPVAWIANIVPCLYKNMRCAFAPDGRHMAFAMGPDGRVGIMGPDREGGFVQKLSMQLGAEVDLIHFSGTGDRLFVAAKGFWEQYQWDKESRPTKCKRSLACLRLPLRQD